ncbi:MAG TPA: metallophosphoesterase [Vicinamibacteria bacterium]|nr:metallophosphoesterase [Vicinamibacteria bacterium]
MANVGFWAAALFFHGGLIAVCGLLLRRWMGSAGTRTGSRLLLQALGDAAVFLGATVILACLATGFGPLSGFTTLRLVSQALFGEGIVMSGIMAGLLWRSRRGTLAAFASLLPLGLLAVYAEAYHREPRDLRVRSHEVDLTRSPARGKLRLLHLSDIQTHRVSGYEERVVSRAMALGPDLIVLTGDYIQPRLAPTRSQARNDLKALLRRTGFGAPLGVFAVRGDVDIDWPEVLEGTGARLLSDSSNRIALPGGVHLTITGLAPGTSRGHGGERLKALLRGAPRDDLRLVLGHNPNFVRHLGGTGLADLALAGHTHGGQVVLPWLGAPYTKTRLPARYASGLHDYQGIRLHVSAGVGMERGTAPQIRFLCPPEICLLEITY